MAETLRSLVENRDLDDLHASAEALVAPFRYQIPEGTDTKRGLVRLGRGEIIKGVVQLIKKKGGENNLHYHTNVETFWFVLKGRVRFYGPGDKVVGELGPGEGIITPRYSRYWFENAGEGDEYLELLQVAASDSPGLKNGRTDVSGVQNITKVLS